MITAEDIKKLRLETGAGVMDSKKALEEAKGNFEKAKQILAQNAQAIAKKKSDRATKHGLIETYLHAQKVGVLLEINCESDFVARNDEFKNLSHEIAMQIASMNPKDIDELLSQNYIRDDKLTIKNLVEQATAKIGENIRVKRFCRFELGEEA
jgi:elongation factor Ts